MQRLSTLRAGGETSRLNSTVPEPAPVMAMILSVAGKSPTAMVAVLSDCWAGIRGSKGSAGWRRNE